MCSKNATCIIKIVYLLSRIATSVLMYIMTGPNNNLE